MDGIKSYTVQYAFIGEDGNNELKWSKLEKVVADGFTDFGQRYFIFSDKSRIEIPYKETVFFFSPERYEIIKEVQEALSKSNEEDV